MDQEAAVNGERQARLLQTLERLLSIEATDVQSALNQASQLLAEVLDTEKSDALLLDPSKQTLVAVGSSQTPLAARQRALGLDQMPLANGGTQADVFRTGVPYITGRAEQDPNVLRGVRAELGVRSMLEVPLTVDGERRGVLAAGSTQPDAYTADDVAFLGAVASWLGQLMHRAELVERLTSEAAALARRQTAEELLSAIAHDMGNLLTPILGNASILRMRAERQGRNDDVATATALIDRVLRLRQFLDQLLDSRRLDEGLFTLTLQPVDLAALVRETVSRLHSDEVPIEVRAPDELIVEVDPDRLRQALENLLSNALTYSPPSTPVLVEVAEETGPAAPSASIAVRDRGPGIAPELLPRLFTRFGRSPTSRGLGLGLYLAHGIATAHGGTLTVDSKPGAGATFRLRIPRRQPDGPR